MMSRTLLLLLILTLFSARSVNAQVSVARFYVSATAKQNGAGTIADPMQKLSSAIEKAKQTILYSPEGIDSVEINLRAGIYTIDNTIEIVEGKTWVSRVPLVIKAYKNEKVAIHGGKIINTNLAQKVTDKNVYNRFLPEVAPRILQINLKDAGIKEIGNLHATGFSHPYGPSLPELFLNGQPGHIARWPNNGTILIDNLIDSGSVPRWGDTSQRGGKFTYSGTRRPSRWKDPANVWLYGFFMWGYADETVPLKSIDTVNRIITTNAPSMYGFGTGKPWRAWYAFNLPEEIDSAGEYYIDQQKQILYFLKPHVLNEIEISLLETPLIALEGVKNVTIEDLKITCGRGMGIYMQQTAGVRIKSCTFSNLGMMAISTGKGIEPFEGHRFTGSGKPAPRIVGSIVQHLYENSTYYSEAGYDNGIIDCEVSETGAGGIFLSGGDRLSLQPANNFVHNCRITNYNRLERTHRPGIWLSGVGNRISNCEVYNAPSLGILIHGNNHIVEYNNVHDLALDVDDMGAIYNGRDPSERGTVIRYNYIHHIGGSHKTMGIYLDDGACGMTVYSNVFFRSGTVAGFIGGGRDNIFTNNIFIDTKYATHNDTRLNTWAHAMLDSNGLFTKRLNAVNFQHPPYSVQYPDLKNYFADDPQFPKRDTFALNIMVNIRNLIEGDSTKTYFAEDNFITSSDPGFVSYKDQNFNLKKDALIWQNMPGFKPIPFNKIGYRAREK